MLCTKDSVKNSVDAQHCACASVCVLKPSVCSEKFCDSWPKVVYQLGDHQMDASVAKVFTCL